MLKKTIKYTDFNGNEQERVYYFNLTEAEVSEMELSKKGGLEAALNKIVSEQDGEKIIEFFKWFILRAYGEKSDDGQFFVKNDEIREKFVNSAAYNVLFMEMLNDATASALFVEGVLPKKLIEAVKAQKS